MRQSNPTTASRLDRILEHLRTTPPDRALGNLEDAIRGMIAGRRELQRAISALAILRPIAVCISLLSGAGAGGVAAMLAPAATHPMHLSVAEQLPSTLLENAR